MFFELDSQNSFSNVIWNLKKEQDIALQNCLLPLLIFKFF